MKRANQIYSLAVALFFLGALSPLVLFAAGSPEPMISDADIIRVIKENAYDLKDVFDKSCGVCHSADAKYPVLGATEGFEHSGHKLGFNREDENSYYANGRGCQQCHTSEGFIEYVSTGSVDPDDYVAYPSQIGCFSCHEPHETGDFSLRTTKAVTLKSGDVYNKGDGNLCANCHLSRGEAAAIVVPTPANRVSAYFGPHHGPEADMFLGVNAYEYPGKTYTNSVHTDVIVDSRVSCHLALPEGRYSLSPKVGGHSFYLKGEVHGSEKLNLAACASCHDGIKQEGEFFDIKQVDYDNDGTVETVQGEVEGLLHLIVNEDGTGVLQTVNPPAFKADGTWNRTQSEELRSADVIGAIYNYKFVEEDRSNGIHNTNYTIQVLYDTISALDSSFDTSKRP